MLYGVSTAKAVAQLRNEGFQRLFRGVLPPLCQKSLSVSIMFGSYDLYHKKLMSIFPHMDVQVSKTCGACLAGLTEALLLSPFERTQTLLQDRKFYNELHNTGHAVNYLRKNHGYKEFYRSLKIIILRNSLSNSLFFYSREKAQIYFNRKEQKIWAAHLQDFVCGGVIGACISTIFYPLNVVKIRTECRLGGEFQSISFVFKKIFEERDRKWSKMYSGVQINFSRSLISWGIINVTYEILKNLIEPRENDKIH